jgi:hypothetical protein
VPPQDEANIARATARVVATVTAKVLKPLAAILKGGGLWWGLALSLVLAAASLGVAIVIVIGWSVDHFKRAGATPFWGHRHPVVRALGLFAKNLAGAVLVLLGLVMALPGIPGQGILTIVIGVTLLDFPGKRRIERRLIGRPRVLRALNRLRARFHRPALELD